MKVTIRRAVPEDAAALLKIYSYYVKNTAVTFEYEVPTEAEFSSRIKTTLEKYPYILAEADGCPVGFSYAGEFKNRSAYDWSAEITLYMDKDYQNCGIGKLLYTKMEEILRKMGMTNLYACIAFPEEEDAYLTRDSEKFHKKLGFTTVANFARCGYKFQNWYGMIWMEKIIGPHLKEQPPVLTYEELMQNS